MNCIQVKRSWLRDMNTKHQVNKPSPDSERICRSNISSLIFKLMLNFLQLTCKIIPNNTCAGCRDMSLWAFTSITHQVCKLTHANTLSVCLYLFPSLSIPQSNTLCWESHVEKHSAFHCNHTRLLSNYFWSRPSWPGHCLSAMAWEFIRQNSDRWEGGHFFFMCNAALPAYMPPRRCLHDGSMLILINT